LTLLTGSEWFEVAYKWILAIPKRDVRALCANQSVPGSTKQRKSKKKPKVLIEEDPSLIPSQDSQAPLNSASPTTKPTQPALPFLPVPSPQNSIAPFNPAWTARNPALAQYHQYVCQQNTIAVSPDEAYKSIMQQLQTPPIQSKLQEPLERRLSSEPRGPDIILPPPQFNMGRPPPTLLAAPRKEVQIAPQPSKYPPSFVHSAGSHSDVSAGILFVHSDLGQNPQWRDQFASQFYRSPSSLKEIQLKPLLPQLSHRPLAPAPAPQHTLIPLTRPEYLPPNLQNSSGQR